MKKSVFEPLDDYERDLIESIENDEFVPVENLKQEIKKAMVAAKNSLKKDKRINIRLTQKDYHQIRVKAIQQGMPYQTLLGSIIHKYVS